MEDLLCKRKVEHIEDGAKKTGHYRGRNKNLVAGLTQIIATELYCKCPEGLLGYCMSPISNNIKLFGLDALIRFAQPCENTNLHTSAGRSVVPKRTKLPRGHGRPKIRRK